MFWDGTRWVDEGAKKPAPTPTGRRGRDWLATSIMGLVLVALIVPMVGASAADNLRVLLSKDEGSGGTVTILSLTGFEGNASGQVTFDHSAVGMPAYTTAGDGTASVTVTVPLNALAGNRQIETLDAAGDSLMSRTFIVTGPATGAVVTPTETAATVDPTPDALSVTAARQGNLRVLLSKDEGPAGTVTVLSLTGFAGYTSGQVTFEGSTVGMPAYTTAINGTASLTVTVPPTTPVGNHQIATINAAGVSLMSRTFTVTGATVTGATVTSVTPIPRRHAEGDTDAHPGRHAEGDTDAHPGRHAEGDTDAHPGRHAEGDTDAHPGRHAEGDTDAHAGRHAEGDTDAHADAHPDTGGRWVG